MNLLLKNGLVLKGEEFEVENSDVLIKDGYIDKVQKNITNFQGKILDVSNKIVMPGLVNAHAHSDENFLKGKLDNLPLELWMLYSYPVLEYGPFSKKFIYLRTMLGALEMIKNGVTHVQDDVSGYPKPTLDSIDSVISAYNDLGLRASITANLNDKPWHEILPYISQELPGSIKGNLEAEYSVDTAKEFCEKIIDKWHEPDGKIHFVLAPSGPQRCSDEFLLMMYELSERENLPVHTHVLETKIQAVTGHEFYGKSIIKHLNDLNILNEKTTIIHSVWVDDEDIKIMGDAGVSVAHNPISNLKLGSGIMPLRIMLEAGVNVALGSDGMSSNDTQNIFEVMKFTGLLHKISNPDYKKWPSSSEVLKMATKGGAISTLTSKELGTIEEGKKADIIVLDNKSLAFTPQNDIKKHLVYCEDGRSVETSIIDGEIVMKNNELLNVDEEYLLAEIKDLFSSFKKDYEKHTVKANEKLFTYVDDVYWKCVGQNVGINRWVQTND